MTQAASCSTSSCGSFSAGLASAIAVAAFGAMALLSLADTTNHQERKKTDTSEIVQAPPQVGATAKP